MKSFEISKRLVFRGVGEGPGQQRGAGRGRRQHRRVRSDGRGTTSTSCGTGCPRGATSRGRCGRWRYRRIMGRGSGSSGCRTRRTGWPRPRQRCCWKRSWSRSSIPTVTATVLGAVAHDALAVTRKRCWKQDWVLDLDIRAFFDSVPHDLLLKAVAHHTDERWVLLYIERWLKAPMQMPDGTLVAREKGTPQGSPISPLLANLFMHYAFDRWMDREYPGCPFERYADDVVVHCDTEEQARHASGRHRRPARGPGPRAAPRQDEDRVLQRREPPRGCGAHQLRLPRLHLPGSPGSWPARVLRELPPGHEHQGEEGERPADQGLAPQPSQRHGPVRPRRGHQPPGARLDQLLRGLLPLRVVLLRAAHRRAPRPMGHAEVQTTARQARRGVGTGWTLSGTAAAHPLRPLAPRLASPDAGLWEPYDGRLSRTVLREREGEVPSRHSPTSTRPGTTSHVLVDGFCGRIASLCSCHHANRHEATIVSP